MKKKIYFIISSILGILLLVYTNIINVQKLIATEMNVAQDLVGQEALDILNNPIYYYVLAILGIIFFSIILVTFIKEKESYHKNLLITSSIIIGLTSTSEIGTLIAILNIFLLSKIPKVPVIKKECPKLNYEYRNKKEIIKAISLVLTYLILMFFLGDIISLFVTNITYKLSIIINLSLDIFLLVLTFLLFSQEIIQAFKILLQNIKAYSSYILKNYAFILLANITISFLIMFFTKSQYISQNEASLDNLPIWYLFPMALIYAPIVEESVFRGGLRRIIKNDTLFIIISGVSFGLLHTIGQEETILNTLIFALPYMAIGLILAKTYVKTNNISINMSLHALNNLLGCLAHLL